MSKELVNIKAKDGIDIPVITFDLDLDSMKAVVVICHGFGEYAGLYENCSEHLQQAGYASVILTQRGHGVLSDDLDKRRKLQGIIPGYQSFLDDIDAIIAYIKQKAPNTPIALYGHSMGGNIATNYLLRRNQRDFVCAILESPWLGLYQEMNPFTVAIAKILGSISPSIAIVKKLPVSAITSDKTMADTINNDPLYHNRISLRLFSGIKEGCTYALQHASELTIPVLLANAKFEAIVSNEAIADFARRCSNISTKEYESCHAIHNDVRREEFFSDIKEFLDEHIRSSLSRR